MGKFPPEEINNFLIDSPKSLPQTISIAFDGPSKVPVGVLQSQEAFGIQSLNQAVEHHYGHFVQRLDGGLLQ